MASFSAAALVEMDYVLFSLYSIGVPRFGVTSFCFLVTCKRTCHEAWAAYHQMMSLMAVIGLIKLLSGKRLERAVQCGEAIPPQIRSNLEQILSSSKEQTLTVVGGLQSKALHFCSSDHGVAKK